MRVVVHIWDFFWGGGFLGIDLRGYLFCGPVAFGVMTEIPGSLYYGTVRVEYASEKVLKLGLGTFFPLHWLLLLFFHGQTYVCLWTYRARLARVCSEYVSREGLTGLPGQVDQLGRIG